MPAYTPPVKDQQFLLHDLFKVSESDIPGYEDLDRSFTAAVLEEAGKIAANVLHPLNVVGDTQGCSLENGVVRAPDGFKAAWDEMANGGWMGLAADPELGGQGMPYLLNTAVGEFFSSANMAFQMYAGLVQGAALTLAAHGSDEQRATYVPSMHEGRWSGTMNLTEPHCGTDLGLIRTKAEPQNDGSYRISGQKIWISGGEHDLAENIVHLVLARIPDGPEGIKGISLFVVPKFLPNEDGSLGERNRLSCGGLEEKMGIHGNAFARERLQGRDVTGAKNPDGPADPVIVHPDVRRNLLDQKSFVEGARALAFWGAEMIDRARRMNDGEAEAMVSLLIPVMKGFLTDKGFEACVLAQQTLGGSGFTREAGIEQFVRDARIAMIYEGTNGIQSLDLVGRKLPANGGKAIMSFFELVKGFIKESEGNEALKADFLDPLKAASKDLQAAGMYFLQEGSKNPLHALAGSYDFMHLFGHVSLGFMWARMARASMEALELGAEDTEYYETKIMTGRYYMSRQLPATGLHLARITSGAEPVMDLGAERF